MKKHTKASRKIIQEMTEVGMHEKQLVFEAATKFAEGIKPRNGCKLC